MMINSIDASSFDSGTAYIAGTRYKLGDFTPYLYVTDDYGKNWKLITSGIESEHFTRVVRSDKVNKNILYAGTETGMYISFDKGNSWNKFQKNLPIVPITDLTIKDNSLISKNENFIEFYNIKNGNLFSRININKILNKNSKIINAFIINNCQCS